MCRLQFSRRCHGHSRLARQRVCISSNKESLRASPKHWDCGDVDVLLHPPQE
jgi:hypothetical protein